MQITHTHRSHCVIGRMNIGIKKKKMNKDENLISSEKVW